MEVPAKPHLAQQPVKACCFGSRAIGLQEPAAHCSDCGEGGALCGLSQRPYIRETVHSTLNL